MHISLNEQVRARVWFHKGSAIGWVLAGIAAFLFGWQASVVFVVVASVYANVKSDWGAAEAADDTKILAAIAESRDTILAAIERHNQP